jgi:hypothetical protein
MYEQFTALRLLFVFLSCFWGFLLLVVFLSVWIFVLFDSAFSAFVLHSLPALKRILLWLFPACHLLDGTVKDDSISRAR